MPTKSSSIKRILGFSDLQAPYHDQRAVDLVLKVGRAFKPDILISVGDFVDFYAISHFDRDPKRKTRLVEELEIDNRLLDAFDSLGVGKKFWLDGNHEYRLERYIWKRAPELDGMVQTVPEALHLKERGWHYTEYGDTLHLGKVFYTHDLGEAGRYAVLHAGNAAQHNIVFGHTHRLGYIVEGTAIGEQKLSFTTGHLCDPNKADYKHKLLARRDWAQGFFTGYLLSDGVTFLVPHPIVGHRTIVEGRVYSA